AAPAPPPVATPKPVPPLAASAAASASPASHPAPHAPQSAQMTIAPANVAQTTTVPHTKIVPTPAPVKPLATSSVAWSAPVVDAPTPQPPAAPVSHAP